LYSLQSEVDSPFFREEEDDDEEDEDDPEGNQEFLED